MFTQEDLIDEFWSLLPVSLVEHHGFLMCGQQWRRSCQWSERNRAAGRDHWPRANTMLFAGGGLQTGQIIEATDSRGRRPRGPSRVARRLSRDAL